MKPKYIGIIALVCLIALPAGQCMLTWDQFVAHVSEGVAIAADGIGAVQSAQAGKCSAIDSQVADAMQQPDLAKANCTIRNQVVNFQKSAQSACSVVVNSQTPPSNISTLSVIIGSALANIKTAKALGCS